MIECGCKHRGNEVFSPASLTSRYASFFPTPLLCEPLFNSDMPIIFNRRLFTTIAKGSTRSHSEPGSQALLRRLRYCGAKAHGKLRRCGFLRYFDSGRLRAARVTPRTDRFIRIGPTSNYPGGSLKDIRHDPKVFPWLSRQATLWVIP